MKKYQTIVYRACLIITTCLLSSQVGVTQSPPTADEATNKNLETKLKVLENKVDQVSSRVVQIRSQSQSFAQKSDLQPISSKLNNLDKKLGELGEGVKSLRKEINALKTNDSSRLPASAALLILGLPSPIQK
jgi:peptidoglycan hydrolase CwlO-like protein